MRMLVASLAVALALGFTSPIVVSDAALAKGPPLKTCSMKSGKKAVTWKCQTGQSCCVTADGKGTCGMQGLGCF